MTFSSGDMVAINEGPGRGIGFLILGDEPPEVAATRKSMPIQQRGKRIQVEVVYARGVDGYHAGDRLALIELPLHAKLPAIDRVLQSAERLPTDAATEPVEDAKR